MASIGKSITIRGDVSGEEDLVIEGRVEGRVELAGHHLTVGANGQVHADVTAKGVTVIGTVQGNVAAAERAEIRESGVVEGDLSAPRIVIHEGARLNGGVSMKAEAPATARPARRADAPPPAAPEQTA